METHLESFSFTNPCLHPCENTVPVKIENRMSCLLDRFYFVTGTISHSSGSLLCDHLFKKNRNWLIQLSFDAGKIYGNKM